MFIVFQFKFSNTLTLCTQYVLHASIKVDKNRMTLIIRFYNKFYDAVIMLLLCMTSESIVHDSSELNQGLT